MKRIALFVALLSISVFTLSACNTVHGFGKDVEKVGSAIGNAAK